MPFTLKVYTRPGFKQIYNRYKSADKKRQDNQREEVKHLGQKWVEIAKQEAPEGRTGRFRKAIFYRTYVKGDMIELRTYHPEPLGTWITKGTRPHIIRAKNKKALRFLWERGPRSSETFTAFHFYKWVSHPGTKANPYHIRATKRWRPAAIVALRKIVQRFVIDLKA